MKRCAHCGDTQDLTAFPVDRSRKDGLYPYCRTCAVELQLQWRQNNPGKHAAQIRRYTEKNKARNSSS